MNVTKRHEMQGQIGPFHSRNEQSMKPAACGLFHGYTVQNPVLLATQWLHGSKNKKPRYLLNSRVSFTDLVPVR